MDALDNIFSRVSVRAYTDKRISEDAIHTILQAAMSGPSCVNSRDWSFIVVQNRETLRKMAAGNGKPAAPLFTADAAVLICGDLTRAHSRCPEYWVIDCAIAGQNMVLAANALGIGSVWLAHGRTPPAFKRRQSCLRSHRPSFPIPFLRLASRRRLICSCAISTTPTASFLKDLKYLNLHIDYG